MKKLFLSALLAALAFGSAQAIVSDVWDSGTIGNSHTISPSYHAWSTFEITASFTLPALPADEVLEVLRVRRQGADYNNDNWITINVDSTGALSLVTKGGSGNDSQTLTTDVTIDAKDRTTVSFVVNRTGNESGVPAVVNIALYVDGVAAGELQMAQGTGFNTPLDTILTNADGVTYDFVSAYHTGDGENYETLKTHAEKASVVPEPTALALLALGVAGLALRRRAA